MPSPTARPASGDPSVPPTAPRSRDPLVDALRSVALARVVLWHAFAAPWLSWIFPAMPIMFFLAGAVLAGSSTGGRSAGGVRTLGRRLVRLLLPFWVYSAAVAAVTVVRPSAFAVDDGTWLSLLVPLPQPTGTDRDWLTGHLWYLTDYLVLLTLVPLAALLARRIGLVIGGALLGLATLELAPLAGLPSLVGPARMAVGDLLCYGLFAVLGIAWATRRPAKGGRADGGTVAGRTTAGLAAAGLALIAATVLASAVVPLPRGSLNESYLLLAVAALGWLLLIGAAQRPLRRLAQSPRVAPAARAVSARALTIYLWHPAAILIALAIAPDTSPAVLLFTVLLTGVAVVAFGWVEDVAARRPARWWPGRSRRGGSGPARVPLRIGLVGAALAGVTLIVGGVSAVTANGTETAVAAIPPPSDRTALADTAFAAAARELREQAPAKQLRGEQLQTALERWIAGQPEISDAVVSVAAGSEVWSGSAARSDGEPRAADFSVGIASMTKTFTASLAVQLAEEGRLDLDAPVPELADVVPLPDAGTVVTPRQLLQHSSGLIQYTDAPGYDAGRVYTAGELVSLSTQAPLQHPPDAGVTYSNSNYLWLGLILESLTESSYGTLLADRIAGPLGLSTVDLPVDERTGWVGSASGGISSTPADVARFFDALVNRAELLPQDALHRMTDLNHLNGGLGIWPLCPCGQTDDGVKWATGLGHFNGDGAAFAFPDDKLAVYLRIGGPGDPPVAGDRMVQMRDELIELIRTTAIRADDVEH
ncbi:serine hydrolase [Nakamurella sp.]|uniref:serine hydrolase n=1 Tax=Nakamurella sp. TaxID=1869182 RepID=UPI0037851BC4